MKVRTLDSRQPTFDAQFAELVAVATTERPVLVAVMLVAVRVEIQFSTLAGVPVSEVSPVFVSST